jgi:hypothetical protein
MPELMVLRNAAASGLEGIGPDATTPPEPRIETHDLSLHEAVSAARDPDVAAVATPMPIKLIKPFDVAAGGAATGDAWGIAAVKATRRG